MNNTVIAARSDGLGERLNAILNGLLISEITNCEFKFHWPYTRKRKWHSIDSAESIFSKDFIEKHIIHDSKTINNSQKIEFKKGSIEEVKKHLLREIKSGKHIIGSTGSYFDRIKATKNFKKQLWQRVQNRLTFSEQITDIERFVFDIDLPSKCHAIHIRSGDIIYGNFAITPKFRQKATNTPIVSKLIKNLTKQNNSVILFGQEHETIHKLASFHKIINARSYYENMNLNPLQEAMAPMC